MSKFSWGMVALIAILLGLTTSASAASFKYTTPPGFFLQEDPAINSSPPDYTKISYGLLNRPYPTDPTFDPSLTKPLWSRFTHYLSSLKSNKTANTTYKLLYLARHGEAYHNVAQSYYGSKCWDCYWSQQPGNGTVTWLDAEMTPRGLYQILASNTFWQDIAPTEQIPFPESFYVSPMARTLATANLTFRSLDVWSDSKPFAPTVKETLRETINACTCAWRHPKKWISERFSGYKFEDGFSDEDELFNGKTIESATAQALRVTRFLDDIFSNDSSMVISVTTHGVNINPILGVIGHPNLRFNITTGQSIAVLVKAERLVEDGPSAVGDPPTVAEVCEPCGPVLSE